MAASGGAGAAAAIAAVNDITDVVLRKDCYAQNASDIAYTFVGDKRLACRSEADSEMILFYNFGETVKLTGLLLDGPDGELPTDIKIFTNRASLSFDDVADLPAVQDLKLTAASAGKTLPLKLAKFAAVNSVYIFASSTEGKSALSKVSFFGSKAATSDMSKFQPAG